MDTIKIIIADNQALTRHGIITLLSSFYEKALEVMVAFTKEDLTQALSPHENHILVIDYDTFELSDLNELRDIKKKNPAMGILVISDNRSTNEILKVIDTGITNYILKSCEAQELLDAFQAALQSKKYFCNEIMDVILENKTNVKSTLETGNLTNAEIGIVKSITQGLTTKEIAEQKHLSFHTIITHRKNIFKKLGISNSSELLMYAMRTGLIDTTEYYI